MLLADLLDELGGKGLSAVLGLIIGGLIAWVVGYWRRRHLRHKVLHGDARDTVVIHHHLVETEVVPQGRRPTAMRVRALGQEELGRVIPNAHLAAVLLDRAMAV